jgi:hypothetical protein
MTAAKFKPLILSVSGFALSNIANIPELLVRVRVTLRLTVSQSVCLGVEPRLGLMTTYFSIKKSEFCLSLLFIDFSIKNLNFAYRFYLLVLYISLRIKKLRDFNPPANYTDRATAACPRIEGVALSAQRIPMAVNFGFLDRSRYFPFK